MAHIKASATTKGNRDSKPKMLGVKVYAGQRVQPGSILVRQRGTQFHPGFGTKRGGDDTLYAVMSGVVSYIRKSGKKYLTVRPE
ncbi:MAG: 50S ribosomal protein L27 [Microgenomates group bacterium GW2011_GWA1_48_10]|uniref:Large ribosomal subunit protein bL27 n=1 Tax=Candidatus Gottesmanbacteria bacterium RIFCSPHIGHO2_01_FULL_47_48 TaxID=1798381 RepID=A0A1F6A5H2_9BACT|nr:MAG: 50S ribosomal protein L27 [Microgenomates group bacterium GW2011_GWA1_48_10]OGG19712.1 MAG: 50S ribosomal protein L27 [Candidatus Gottesmanbacteria bacterium RIFCSPHIGHO2_01_FULL_47_48]